MILILLAVILVVLVRCHARLTQLRKAIDKVMATQKEIADQLTAANEALTAVGAGVTKIGTETDGLLQKIKDLEDAINNQTNATPELVAAFEAVKATVESLGTLVTSVDDKVPDPVVPPPA